MLKTAWRERCYDSDFTAEGNGGSMEGIHLSHSVLQVDWAKIWAQVCRTLSPLWGLDHKESWAPKNWCFWTVVLEKTLESPLDCKEIQPVHPKGDQSQVFIGRTDVEAETPVTLATWCEELTHWKRPWCWERLRAGEGMTEDEMVGKFWQNVVHWRREWKTTSVFLP